MTRHPVEVEVGTQGDAEAARFRGVKVAYGVRDGRVAVRRDPGRAEGEGEEMGGVGMAGIAGKFWALQRVCWVRSEYSRSTEPFLMTPPLFVPPLLACVPFTHSTPPPGQPCLFCSLWRMLVSKTPLDSLPSSHVFSKVPFQPRLP